jgi:Capsule assembly protein Wzi
MKLLSAYFLILSILGSCLDPGICVAGFDQLEPDARTVPWSSITRLALEGGAFPPAYRPVTEGELAKLLTFAGERVDDRDSARLLWLLNRYQNPDEKNLRLGGRVVGGFSELGDALATEGGLDFAAGHNVFFEPSVEFATGDFWAAVDFRLGGRWASGGIDFSGPNDASDPVTWPGWPLPTGRATVRDARLKNGAWTGQLSRALVGLKLGNWALSAGWDHRRTGPGLTGNLNLDYGGRPFPAVTARRTDSFHWSGIFTHLAPDQMLLRTGLLSEQTISFHSEDDHFTKDANPWFFQWLVGWNVTSWFRAHFTHSVMAASREGTLWPHLFQINFPVLSTTWEEMEEGAVTDRIFAAQFEFRWRDAPWPWLPSDAGRLFWDYGGTDFLPWRHWEAIPQISVPASIVGFELLSPGWDLGFEYAELQHPNVMWYSNSGYREGYTHERWLLGHPLGGSGESFTGLVRVRPADRELQIGLQGTVANWGMSGLTPGTGDRQSLALTLGRTPKHGSAPVLWEITAEWNREKADPEAFLNAPTPGSEVTRNWWRFVFKVGI